MRFHTKWVENKGLSKYQPWIKIRRFAFQIGVKCTVGTVKAGNFVNGVLFRHHSVKTLGTSAWLSLTATDFVQKQSRHDVIFSFEVDSYKI
jgi:hypothetical protein